MSPQNGASPLDLFRHVRDIDDEGEGLRVHVPVEDFGVHPNLGLKSPVEKKSLDEPALMLFIIGGKQYFLPARSYVKHPKCWITTEDLLRQFWKSTPLTLSRKSGCLPV